jgi:ABC-2 type transport system ATP-binding protein
MDAIEIRDVTRQFGAHTAVHDLNRPVPDGTIYSFIGANGSGETTTIRMIMNVILSDRGQIVVLVQRTSAAARDAVGYLPAERGLHKPPTLPELLKWTGR